MAGSNMAQAINCSGRHEAFYYATAPAFCWSRILAGRQDFVLKEKGPFHTHRRMNSTTIKQITSAANKHNEDLIRVYHSADFTDILIMDGASSVAEENFIDNEMGDVAWFVRNFAALLERAISPDRTQAESVSLTIETLHAVFRQQTSAVSMPVYAYPIAAMTWVRIIETRDAVAMQIYCLGDCKTFLLLADNSVRDLDPYVNPQEAVLREEMIRLAEEGIREGAARRERLMPLLRARREFQNTCESPSALCLAPNGPFHAREHTVQVAPNSLLLMMTDGFYRLVDTYELYSIEELASLCRHGDLESLIRQLRDFEMARLGTANLSVKRSDDASAVTWLSGRAPVSMS